MVTLYNDTVSEEFKAAVAANSATQYITLTGLSVDNIQFGEYSDETIIITFSGTGFTTGSNYVTVIVMAGAMSHSDVGVSACGTVTVPDPSEEEG